MKWPNIYVVSFRFWKKIVDNEGRVERYITLLNKGM